MTVVAFPSSDQRRRLAAIGLAAIFAVAVAGCGSQKETPAGKAATSTTEPTPVPTAETTISTNLKAEPQVPKPTGPAPATLVKKDIVTGKGPKAKSGALLSVQYTGVLYSTGEKFDASWTRGAEPFQFPLGAQQVIAGWDKGIPGMRVGGRRELIIPADLAYGAKGYPPAIGPNEPLVFVVDLVKIG